MIRSWLIRKDYENKEFRIKAIKQKDLIPEEKWGQILRSAEITDTVFKLSSQSNIFVPFSELADIKIGFTSGADPWFYVKDVTSELDKEKKRKRILKNSLESKTLEGNTGL